MSLPQYQPIALKRKPAAFSNPDYLFEVKWDGFRVHARIEDGRCKLVSRNGNEFKSFASLAESIAEELKGHSIVLDGEIVCLDDRGKPQFYDLLLRRGEPRLCSFDVLYIDGEDLRYTSLIERKQRLRALLPESDRLFYCDHIEQHGESLFAMACEHDLEGMVAKRKFDPYLPSVTWHKIRNAGYSQWAGRDELFERERETDPDMVLWDTCAAACGDADYEL